MSSDDLLSDGVPGGGVVHPRSSARLGLDLGTCRYQDHAAIRAAGWGIVGITLGTPRFPVPLIGHTRLLAPTRAMFGLDHAEFDEAMLALLDQRGAGNALDVIARFATSAGCDRVALACFEDLTVPGLYCHRTTVARWLEDRVDGLTVPELSGHRPEPRLVQPSLFDLDDR